MGIVLTKTTREQLFSKFSLTGQTRIFSEVNDMGFCYHLDNKIYVAFTFGPDNTARTIEISNRPLAKNCKKSRLKLSACLGTYCLEQTRSFIQGAAEKTIVPVDYPPDSKLEVIYYNYYISLDEYKDIADQKHDAASIPIRHNVWVKFNDHNAAYYLGTIKEKDLP